MPLHDNYLASHQVPNLHALHQAIAHWLTNSKYIYIFLITTSLIINCSFFPKDTRLKTPPAIAVKKAAVLVASITDCEHGVLDGRKSPLQEIACRCGSPAYTHTKAYVPIKGCSLLGRSAGQITSGNGQISTVSSAKPVSTRTLMPPRTRQACTCAFQINTVAVNVMQLRTRAVPLHRLCMLSHL